MLVYEKLKNKKLLSSSENEVAKFLLDYKKDILKLTAQDISKSTYTSASTTIRLAQKLGYSGWSELRHAMYTEKKYLLNNNDSIDYNFPFKHGDSFLSIASKMANLEKNIIGDTFELLDETTLNKVVEKLSNAYSIYIFAMANASTTAYDFKYKMRFLFKPVTIIDNRDDFSFTFQTINDRDACIFISYSGQSFEDLDQTYIIENFKCPTISITSYKENKLMNSTQYNLFIPFKESRYAKIGHFASNMSIHYLLDVLYSSIFSNNYQSNLDKRETYIYRTDNLNQNL